MRILFIIPEIIAGNLHGKAIQYFNRFPKLHNLPLVRDWHIHRGLYVDRMFGGTLNIMRHCSLARSMGVDASLVTPSGKDTYGHFNILDIPCLPWSAIRSDDLCVVPDFASEITDRLSGPVIVYQQSPRQVYNNFNYKSPRVEVWTDSPFMVEVCKAILPGKEIPIVPNIVDSKTFSYREQSERQPIVFAFPRKGPEFIQATQDEYARLGGQYYRFELIDGISLLELAREMQRPQVFLASAEVEGCALPPQESMACGMVVVGKSARGANFAMQHRKTAMVAETPLAAAECLLELEDENLRDSVSRNAYEFISRYFPENEPAAFWRKTLANYGIATG